MKSPWPCHFKYAKIFANFKQPDFQSRKTKNVQISFDRFFFAKLVQFVFLCQRLSKKLNFIKIWQVKVGQNKDLVCYRKKQSFRQCAWGLRQLVLKPGFRPKGRALGMLEKSENFNSLRPILFKLCKKKLQGGQIDPPPQQE